MTRCLLPSRFAMRRVRMHYKSRSFGLHDFLSNMGYWELFCFLLR